MAEVNRVLITGLRETRDGLKSLSDEAAKELTDVLKGVAELVAEDARGRVPVRTGNAARSYRSRGNAKGAFIAFGGAKAEYAPWLDFGGSVGHGHVRGKRGSGATKRLRVEGGRYLYPALAANLMDVTETVGRALNDLVDKYGLEIE